MSDSLRPHGMQQTKLPCPSLSPWVCSNSCPLSLWCHPTISSSLCPSFLSLIFSQHQGLFQWVSSLHQVAKVLKLQLQHQFSSVQFNPSVVSDSLWPQGLQGTGFPTHHQLPELTQTHVHWVGDAIQPSHSLSFPSVLLPVSIFPSIRVFFSESILCIRWPKYWSFSFSISPSNKYSKLISFMVDWFDLFAIQGTLKSLLNSSKA